MRKNLNSLFVIIVLPLLLLLAGCNSEGAFTTIQRIDISPSSLKIQGKSALTLAQGHDLEFVAVAHYSDGSSRKLTDLSVDDWHSIDPHVGSFDTPGVLTGKLAGRAAVAVISDSVTSNIINVEVTNPMIMSIAVTPSLISVAKGQTQPLVATAIYSDNTSSDVSSLVSWVPVDRATAIVTPEGLLLGVDEGSTTLTASKDGVTSNTVSVEVTSAVMTSLMVTPSPVSVAKGQTEQLVATAIYSDSTSSDVSNSVTWKANDTATATVMSGGLLSGLEVGSTTLTASKDGVTSNTVNVAVTNAVITSIMVTPSPVSVAKDQTQPLVATATYSDGSSSDVSNSVTWMVDDTATAIVMPTDLLLGVEVGSTSLTASKDGVTSNTVNVEVTSAVITSIMVAPSSVSVAKGQTQQLVATAIYSDSTSSDVSNSVTWKADDTATATVMSGGLLSGLEVGSTTLTASKDGVTSNTVNVVVTNAVITSIMVTPSPVSVAKGQTEQLVAIAIYSDKTSSDVSNSVTWDPVDTATAIVTPDGLLSGVVEGSTTLTASKNGVTSNTVNVEVTSAVITSIAVTPSPVNLLIAQTQQMVATATYSDGSSSDVSDSVAWMPVDMAIAIVTPDGLLSGVNEGSTTLTASKNGVTSNTVNVTITSAVITAIQVTPPLISMSKGQMQLLVATATYSDGSSSDVSNSVTWTPVDTAIATVTSGGLLSGAEVGNTTLTAAKDGVTSNTVNVEVNGAVMTSILVAPSPISMAKGQAEQLVALAIYSDGSSVNVSNSVTWIVADTAFAVVTPDGLISGVEMGSTTLTASKDGVTSSTVNVEVTPVVITSILVMPSSVSVSKGQTQQMTATAIYSDSSSSDVSSSVTWTSVDTATATVTPTGLLSGVAVGSTTLTAFKDGVISAAVDVVVTPAILTAITVTPTKVDVRLGATKQLTATATYSDSTSSDVSSSVTWTSSDTAKVTVTPDGVLTGVDLGSANVMATKDGISSNVAFVNVCNLTTTCIDLFDVGNGKLFTSSPSVAYLNSIGLSYNGSSNTAGGVFGKFYQWNSAGVCNKYNALSLGERTNWRLPTKDELQYELYGKFGNMNTARGWPVFMMYWSSTISSGSVYYGMFLYMDAVYEANGAHYVSCVSNP